MKVDVEPIMTREKNCILFICLENDMVECVLCMYERISFLNIATNKIEMEIFAMHTYICMGNRSPVITVFS